MNIDLDTLDFAKGGGLVTVVAIDDVSGRVLMVAHADRVAVERTLASGEMHYTSRTRGPWHKGATSGNVQALVSLEADCDRDAILARVRPAGPACHTGSPSCFSEARSDTLDRLDATIAARARDDAGATSYTKRLLADRNLRLKKIGEEAAELVLAAADADGPRAVEEAADLLYHSLVVLRALGLSLDDVRQELARRER